MMNKISRYIYSVFSLILFFGCLLFAQEKRIIGILPFTNNGAVENEWIGRGIEEILYDKFSNLSNIDVFEKETLIRILAQRDINSHKDVTIRKAFTIGQETGIEVLLTGNYLLSENNLNVYFRLISTYTGADILQKYFNQPIENIFSMHQEAILSIMEGMSLNIDATEGVMLAKSSTNSIEAFKSYCQAYSAFQQGSSMDVVSKYFLRAIELDSNFWEAQYNLGVIYYNYDLYERAIQQFEKVIQKNPTFFKPFYGLGVISYFQKERNKAIRNFEQVLNLKPDHDRSLYYLGRVYLMMDSITTALKYLDKSSEINPNFAPTQFQIGVANMRRGWYKSAINAFKKSLKLLPENARAHNALGECYYTIQRFDDAIFHYNRSIEIQDNYSTSHFNLGNAVYKKGALQDIVDAYLDILETRYTLTNEENRDLNMVEDLRTLRNRGNNESNIVYAQMIKAYRKALKIEPGFFEASFNLALTYENLGVLDSAQYFYEKSLELNPGLVRAHMRLGRLFENQGKYQEALTAFKNVVKIEPSYFSSTPRLGEAYRNINIIEDVLEEYQIKNNLTPNDPKTLIVLARIFNSLGRLGQAEQYYQQIVQIDPRNQEANQELQHLKVQMKKL